MPDGLRDPAVPMPGWERSVPSDNVAVPRALAMHWAWRMEGLRCGDFCGGDGACHTRGMGGCERARHAETLAEAVAAPALLPNLDVTRLDGGAGGIFLLKLDAEIGEDLHSQVAAYWARSWRRAGVEPAPPLVLAWHGATLEHVTDAELAAVGLQRIPKETTT